MIADLTTAIASGTTVVLILDQKNNREESMHGAALFLASMFASSFSFLHKLEELWGGCEQGNGAIDRIKPKPGNSIYHFDDYDWPTKSLIRTSRM
jgi:hypothetical protein